MYAVKHMAFCSGRLITLHERICDKQDGLSFMYGPTSLQHFHTTLVAVPICLLSSAVVFDFFALITGIAALSAFAYWTAVIGLASAIVAALAAWMEWLSLPSRSHSKGMAFAHGLVNTLVVILYAGSLLSRSADPSQPQIMAIIFSVMAAVAALVGGWVGGEMIEGHTEIGPESITSLDLTISDDTTAGGLY
jgi:uncharacterized membrane protein